MTRWWNAEIQMQVKIKKQRWKEYLQNKTSDSYEKYRIQRKKAKDMINTAKREGWEEFGRRMEEDSKGNQKLFFRVLKTLRKGRPSNTMQVKSKKGIMLREEAEIMERWREYFSELLNEGNEEGVENGEEIHFELEEESAENEDIKVEEVREAIFMMKRGKAAGSDGITAEMLQNLGEGGVNMLTELCRKVWKEEKIPKDWEVGIIVPLYKKGDKAVCNNYRGITLLSVVLKVYERILERRLRMRVEEQLEESQSGFRRGRSTQDHIFTLKQIIEKKLAKNQKVYLGFIDIQKAFDSVPRSLVWRSLQRRGVGVKLRRNIECIYKLTRNQVRKDNEQSEDFVTKEGLRQGGVLSPLLFIIMMDDIIKELKGTVRQIQVGYRNMEAIGISECAFADDLVLFARSETELKHNLVVWKEALEKRNMRINMEKTKIMAVGSVEETIHIEIDKVQLEQVKSYKYLGVQIQSDGGQEAEINERISAAAKVYFALNRNFIGRKQVSNKTKISVYKAIFRTVLIYGSESWVLTDTLKSRIQAVEMRYLRRVRNVNRMDRMRNESIREQLEVEPVLKTIQRQQLRWFGHLCRMDEKRPVKRIWQAKTVGRRRRGRPKKTWENTIADILSERGTAWKEAINKARDRKEWRKFVYS